ncbi:MAG TPA: glycosyl hydrolase family 18 protein [Mycobacteriales bacterium]|nr:glycosyl hydrolase family 18 protein [Mycobacteriales bacterium]
MALLRTSAAAVIVCLASLFVPPAAPARTLDAQQPFRSSIWLPFWLPGAADEVSANADLFGTASLFWYEAASCSSVRLEPGAGDRGQLRELRHRGLKVMATVVGSGLPPQAAIRCFTDAAHRNAHVQMLVRLAERGHFAGIDIDYETLAHTRSTRLALRVRRAFDRFVPELCDALRAHGKTCTVTVMPRVDDSTRVWLGKVIPGVYDYAALASAADRIRVMAYDEHGASSKAGPVAGYPWVKQVIAYSESKAPAAKIELGIPLYGRDFAHHTGVALTGAQALALARRHGATPHFDPVQREATFHYREHGVRHTVWFSSARAIAVRTRLARAHGMAGAAYWAAGQDPAGTWKAVRRALHG